MSSSSATLETSFGTGTFFQLCAVAGALNSIPSSAGIPNGCTNAGACIVDSFGARDNPARSFAVTGDVDAGEYVVRVVPQPITSPNPNLSLECGGNEGTYNVTLIEGSIDISPRATPIPL